jgi:3-methyl-2-oxobutanoate hydroxymethyltransferase
MPRMNVREIQDKCRRGERISALTAYDYSMARAVDDAGVDVVLVGDSLGMVMMGEKDTLGVTLDQMVHHTRAASRGVRNALLVADLPFLSYQEGPLQALKSAGSLLKRGHAQAVKLEWCEDAPAIVRRLTGNGIPVMGHVGCVPQSVHALGGMRVQGTDRASAARVMSQARALEKAGAFSVVLELLPPTLARRVTAALKVPTIGIGAGPHCDGQVLVLHDLLGLYPDFTPKHARVYLHLQDAIRGAVRQYVADVQRGQFPPPTGADR